MQYACYLMYTPSMTKSEKALEIYKRLSQAMPGRKIELDYNTPWELLVATILSAQCTDKVVNSVTPALFQAFANVQQFADSDVTVIDSYIKKITFHTNKAKNIHAAANVIVQKHGGIVPKTMEELDALPGVARKTANVVLGHAFHVAEGIVIDTHGMRLSHRLGLSTEKDPVKIEQELMALLPKETWIDFGSLLTLHGRYVCIARPHTCLNCPLGDLCPEYNG